MELDKRYSARFGVVKNYLKRLNLRFNIDTGPKKTPVRRKRFQIPGWRLPPGKKVETEPKDRLKLKAGPGCPFERQNCSPRAPIWHQHF